MTNVKWNSSLNKQEKVLMLGLLLIVAIFTLLDVYEDLVDGASLWHVIPEVSIITLTSLAACYLYICLAKSRRYAVQSAEDQVVKTSQERDDLKTKTEDLRKGILESISQQLVQWNLTEAEQEIAFLLIKGFSLSEISEIRKTTPATIRQQASVIYKKSGMGGRAQLSAYFLEDLLFSQADRG